MFLQFVSAVGKYWGLSTFFCDYQRLTIIIHQGLFFFFFDQKQIFLQSLSITNSLWLSLLVLLSLFLTSNTVSKIFISFWLWTNIWWIHANIYLLKFNNKDIRKMRKAWSNVTIKTLERRYWCRYDVFIANFEHTLHLFSSVFIVDLEEINVCWDRIIIRLSLSKVINLFWPLADVET